MTPLEILGSVFLVIVMVAVWLGLLFFIAWCAQVHDRLRRVEHARRSLFDRSIDFEDRLLTLEEMHRK